MKARRRKQVGGIAVAVTMLLTIAYFLFILKLSGAAVASFTVQEFKGDELYLPFGVSLRSGTVEHRVAGPLELTPEMNPLRVNLTAKLRAKRSAHFPYILTVFNENKELVFEHRGSFSTRPGSTTKGFHSSTKSVSNGPFSINQSAEHIFSVEFEKSSEGQIREASIEVRRNVLALDRNIYIPLIISLLLSLTLALSGKGS